MSPTRRSGPARRRSNGCHRSGSAIPMPSVSRPSKSFSGDPKARPSGRPDPSSRPHRGRRGLSRTTRTGPRPLTVGSERLPRPRPKDRSLCLRPRGRPGSAGQTTRRPHREIDGGAVAGVEVASPGHRDRATWPNAALAESAGRSGGDRGPRSPRPRRLVLLRNATVRRARRRRHRGRGGPATGSSLRIALNQARRPQRLDAPVARLDLLSRRHRPRHQPSA